MTNKVQEYIVGSGPPPEWCRHRMMYFRQLDGSVGIEFFGYIKSYILKKGDRLTYQNGKIKIRKGAARWKQRHICSR